MDLIIKRFEELSAEELYEILQVRVAVFVVEQNCVYQEADGKDRRAYHIFLKDDEGIQAYLRVVDRGISFEEVSIGRVLTLKRRCGLGNRILSEGIKVARERMNAEAINRSPIVCQTVLREFWFCTGVGGIFRRWNSAYRNALERKF
jgi:ElaA protein